jgi:hypothetical protein
MVTSRNALRSDGHAAVFREVWASTKARSHQFLPPDCCDHPRTNARSRSCARLACTTSNAAFCRCGTLSVAVPVIQPRRGQRSHPPGALSARQLPAVQVRSCHQLADPLTYINHSLFVRIPVTSDADPGVVTSSSSVGQQRGCCKDVLIWHTVPMCWPQFMKP